MKGSLPSSTVFPYLPSLQQVNMAQNTLKGDPPFSEMLSLSQLHLLVCFCSSKSFKDLLF